MRYAGGGLEAPDDVRKRSTVLRGPVMAPGRGEETGPSECGSAYRSTPIKFPGEPHRATLTRHHPIEPNWLL